MCGLEDELVRKGVASPLDAPEPFCDLGGLITENKSERRSKERYYSSGRSVKTEEGQGTIRRLRTLYVKGLLDPPEE